MTRVHSEPNLTKCLQSPSLASVRVTSWKSNAFQQKRKVEIFVSCTDLVQLDTFSKSDPMCVMSVKKLGHWAEFGRTEYIPNTLRPKFVESFVIESNTSQHPYVRFSVYDMANFTSKDLRKHDFIGSVELELEVLLSTPPPIVRTLRIPGDVKTRGWITLLVEDVVQSRTNVRLHLGASKLEKKGLFGKCDAFFELSRLLNTGDYHPVYRSEVVTRTAEPKWAALEISLQKLCNGDIEKHVQLACWHFSNNGVHGCIGETTFTVAQLMRKNIRSLDLVNMTKKTRSKRYINSGVVRMLHTHVETQYSLLDYVRGGYVVRLAFAIDFTLSNGDPYLTDSLHSVVEDTNEYIQTIECLGAVVGLYDPETKIPVYGFGAKNDSNLNRSYSFPLGGGDKNLEVESIEKLIDLYRQTLRTIKFGGPTKLAPIIQRVADYTQNHQPTSNQQYVVMVIITDGVINDIDDTMEELKRVAHLPISFVITGVGPADFTLMEELFNTSRHGKSIHKSKAIRRRNTHFTAVRQHYNGSELDRAMAREAFAHVSSQIVSYLKTRGIEPNPPKAKNLHAKTAWNDMVDSPISNKSNPSRMGKRATEPIPRCPTCGSVIEGTNNFLD